VTAVGYSSEQRYTAVGQISVEAAFDCRLARAGIYRGIMTEMISPVLAQILSTIWYNRSDVDDDDKNGGLFPCCVLRQDKKRATTPGDSSLQLCG
jgi:hypothetical protein